MRFVLANIGSNKEFLQPTRPWPADNYSLTTFEVMRFDLVSRIKGVVAFKLPDHSHSDSYSLSRFQVIRFVFANRFRVVAAFKLLDYLSPDSYSLPRSQVMCFLFANRIKR